MTLLEAITKLRDNSDQFKKTQATYAAGWIDACDSILNLLENSDKEGYYREHPESVEQ